MTDPMALTQAQEVPSELQGPVLVPMLIVQQAGPWRQGHVRVIQTPLRGHPLRRRPEAMMLDQPVPQADFPVAAAADRVAVSPVGAVQGQAADVHAKNKNDLQ